MRFFWLIPLLLASVWLLGCRNSARSAEVDELQIRLIAPLFPPSVGEGVVKIQVLDATGQPVNDLALNLRGDMTHAGMVPELAQATAAEAGIYTFPFEWTMAGDWVLTVETEVEQDRRIRRNFAVQVDGAVPRCGDGDMRDLDLEAVTP